MHKAPGPISSTYNNPSNLTFKNNSYYTVGYEVWNSVLASLEINNVILHLITNMIFFCTWLMHIIFISF